MEMNVNHFISECSIKGIQENAWLGVENDQLETVQEIKTWPYLQMTYAQRRIFPRRIFDFEEQM